MELDPSTVARWLEPLAKRPEDVVEVFAERRREMTVAWMDGEVREARATVTEGVSARWRGRAGERLAFLSRGDEEARRMMETARAEIASGRVDGQELFRRIRRKLAEQRGIVL